MNRKLKQWLCGVLMICMMAVIAPFQLIQSYAATARISFSDPSTKVGETFEVTMKFTCTSGQMLGDTKVTLDYDTSVLEFIVEEGGASGGAGKISVRSGLEGKTEVATKLKFKALQAGTTAITIADWDGYDNDGAQLSVEKEGSSTIKIEGLPTSSNDASLQSLQISPGTLEPEFSPEVESYQAAVGLDVEKLTVSARANNDKATVAVEGATELAEGENTVVCKITAEDGTTVKSYTIKVNKAEGGASEAGESAEGSEPETAPAPEVLADLSVGAKTIHITALPADVEVPKGFKTSSIAIGDTKVEGWTLESESTPSYCLLYAMNEDGVQNFYRYDISDKTIQRYFAETADTDTSDAQVKLAEDFNSLLDDYKTTRYIMFGLAGAVVILVILLIMLMNTKKHDKSAPGRDIDEVKSPEPSARVSRGRKLSKEERYMMGEEEGYEETDDYIPDPVIEEVPEAAMDMEQTIAENLAKTEREAAAAMEEDDEDFEFFDLDE